MINKKIKMYRLAKDINQEDLANLLNITLTTYNKKETGKAEFTLSQAKKIADFFNTTIDDLFFNSEVNFMNTF